MLARGTVAIGATLFAGPTAAVLARGTAITGSVACVARLALSAITGTPGSRGAAAEATGVSHTADRRGVRSAAHTAQSCAMGSLTGALTCG